MPIVPREGRWLSSARSRGIVLQPTPHPAYGSEFSTDDNRLVRALEGNGAGCRFTPRPVLQAAGPFPVSSTAPHYRRTKSESQDLSLQWEQPVPGVERDAVYEDKQAWQLYYVLERDRQ